MKPIVRYQMNFSGKCHSFSAFFSGLSFFLIVLHYYVFGNYEALQGSAAFWSIYAPMGILGLYMLLSRLVKVDIFLVYACVAILYFADLSVVNFSSTAPQWLNIAEAAVYVLCAAALVLSALGYIPGKWYIAFALLVCVAARVWLRKFVGYFDPLDWKAALPDLSWLCGMLSLSFMCFGLKPKPIRVRKRNAERV